MKKLKYLAWVIAWFVFERIFIACGMISYHGWWVTLIIAFFSIFWASILRRSKPATICVIAIMLLNVIYYKTLVLLVEFGLNLVLLVLAYMDKVEKDVT